MHRLIWTMTLLLGCAWVCQAQPRIVASWDFDQGAGDVLRDVSGNGHDGAIHGATWCEGRSGGGLQFDGVDDFVLVPAAPALDLTDAMSIEVWARLEKLGGNQDRVVLSRADHPLAYDGWGLNWGYGEDFLWGHDGDYRYLGHIGAGEWRHLVLVVGLGGYKVTLYVDGKPRSDSLWGRPMVPSQFPLYIGRRGEGHHFSGVLDQITLYDGALSSQQVAARYRGEVLPTEPEVAAGRRPMPTTAEPLEAGRVEILGAWSALTGGESTPDLYHNLYLAMANRGPEPLRITDVWLDGCHAKGTDAPFADAATEFVFAGTVPSTIAPGGAGVLNLKLLRGASVPEELSILMQEAGGKVLQSQAGFAPGPARCESLAFDEDLRGAWAYLRANEDCELQAVSLAGADVDVDWAAPGRSIAARELLPVRLSFSAPLVPGTPILLNATTGRGTCHAFMHAFAASFPVGMYRVQRQTVGEDYRPPEGREWLAQYTDTFAVSGKSSGQAPDEWLDDCRRHYIDTLVPDYVARGGEPSSAARFGLSVVPYAFTMDKYHDHPAISAWYLADEPGREPVDEVLGRIETIRAKDPTRPIAVTINPPVWPRGMDFDHVDIGYQDTYPVSGDSLDTIAQNVALYRDLIAPKPVVFIPQCFRRAPNQTVGWNRFPTPEEERFMVLMSLAAGARGEVYFAYNVEPNEPIEGCGLSKAPEAQALWAEIGRINLELRTLAPLLSQSCVIGTQREDDVEVARLALGRDTIACIVLNHDYEYSKETFAPHAKENLALSVPVPGWLQVSDGFAVTADGLTSVPYEDGTLNLQRLDAAAIVLVTADAGLRQRLEARRAELMAEAGG